MELRSYGVWIPWQFLDEEELPAAAAVAEELGYGALWLGGSPRISQLRALLEGSERIVVATSVVNVWGYDPGELAAEWARLEEEFPGRALAGIGVGHPEATAEYAKPLTAVRELLDAVDAAPVPIPRERRALAALGPKMLDLARERSLGSIPYFVSVEHTRFARERLGPGPLLAPEMACVVETDREQGLHRARRFAELYLGLTNYTNALIRHGGFTEQDIAEGGSEALIDAVVPQGSAEQVAAVARAHRAAGADHVVLQAVAGRGIPRREWTSLALALFD